MDAGFHRHADLQLSDLSGKRFERFEHIERFERA